MNRSSRPFRVPHAFAAALALLAVAAPSRPALAQTTDVYDWSTGPMVARLSPPQAAPSRHQRFLDVYCIDMPEGAVENIVHGLLGGDAISYYRVAYANGLHGHMVTSTVPKGRSEADEYARLLRNEQESARAMNAVASTTDRFRVGTEDSPFGPVVRMRILDIEGGDDNGPFPVTRPLLNVPDEPLYSLSAHRMFVRGGNRYEVAVPGVPRDGESRDALEQRAERMADAMPASLQSCTAGLPAAKDAASAR